MAVLDASMAVALIVDLPWSQGARRVVARESRLVAPTIYPAEVANAIWKNVRAGVLAGEDAVHGLRTVVDLVELRHDRAIDETALEISIKYDHPVYDCLYLALARRESLPLAAADRKLAGLAEKMRVDVQGFDALR